MVAIDIGLQNSPTETFDDSTSIPSILIYTHNEKYPWLFLYRVASYGPQSGVSTTKNQYFMTFATFLKSQKFPESASNLFFVTGRDI